MSVFKAGGHEWRLEIGLGTIRRLRTDAGLDLSKGTADGGIAATILSDSVTIGKALWVLCRDQAAGRGITTIDDFYELFPTPEALEEPCAALCNAVLDFFLPGRAGELKKRMPAVTAKMNAAAAKLIAAAADETSNDSVGSGPDSAG